MLIHTKTNPRKNLSTAACSLDTIWRSLDTKMTFKYKKYKFFSVFTGFFLRGN